MSEERHELIENALWLISESELSEKEWNEMVTDCFSEDYIFDRMAETVYGWDEDCLRAFVNKWKHKMGR